MQRIFVAYPIPSSTKEIFSGVSKRNQLPHSRWTPKENMHITLFFIGEVEEKNIETIKDELKNVFEDQKKFNLQLEGIKFKGKKKSGMVWAEFRKCDSFSELSDKIYQSVNNYMTIEVVHKDPIPHCTLARTKPGFDPKALVTSIDKNILLNVDVAELWMTVRGKDGLKYESLIEYPFNII